MTAVDHAELKRADLEQWQADQSEWFGAATLEVVAEYAAWRDRQASLRTQAPDSWRPDREAVARVLKAWCEGGLLQDYASVADAILALRPQTAESGK